MHTYTGVPASTGIVVGPVEQIDHGTTGLHRIVCDPFRERALYDVAVVLAKDELRRLSQRAKGPDADILLFQIALLEDESFTNEIGDYIAAGAGGAAAVERAEQIFAGRLKNVDDEYIRERSVDVCDVCRRVVDILDGRPRRRLHLKRPSILVADRFFPSDLFSLDRRMVLGLASDQDSTVSHAAIMARSMGIPAVVQLGGGTAAMAVGHRAILDADNGTLIVEPDGAQIAQADCKIALSRLHGQKPDPVAALPCLTKDGTAFRLMPTCNISDSDVPHTRGAAGIGLVTAIISAWIPAKRAVRVSPVEAIRQTKDVKLRGREVRTSRLTEKLFGFSGMLAAKNFKRNRKRYRSTVVGLFLSVTLFISASSFCAYLTDAVDQLGGDSTLGVQLYYSEALPEGVTPEQRLGQLAAADGVESGFYTADSYASLHFAKEDMDPDYWKDTGLEGDRSAAMYFLRDEDFRQLLRDNGLPEEDYFRPDAPQAVAWDMLDIWRSTEGSKYNKLYHYHLLNGSSLPITGTESSYQPMDGWFTTGDRITRDGTEYVLYYPEDYIDDYYTARSEGEIPDESRAQAVPASEAVLTRSYTVGAILKEAPDFLGTGDLYLLYPYSMYEAVTGQAPAADAFWFRSSDHAASYESMGQILMELGNSRSELQNLAANGENQRAMVTVVNVFSYGFIILISLISMTNVFNTISTSIALRRREFAMLRSVGLTQRGFARMMDYECIIYGARALLWGLPASVLVTYGIYCSVAQSIAARFYIPWYSVAIAVGSVFVVVFATMLYATRKIRNENPIEALKQENL